MTARLYVDFCDGCGLQWIKGKRPESIVKYQLCNHVKLRILKHPDFAPYMCYIGELDSLGIYTIIAKVLRIEIDGKEVDDYDWDLPTLLTYDDIIISDPSDIT